MPSYTSLLVNKPFNWNTQYSITSSRYCLSTVLISSLSYGLRFSLAEFRSGHVTCTHKGSHRSRAKTMDRTGFAICAPFVPTGYLRVITPLTTYYPELMENGVQFDEDTNGPSWRGSFLSWKRSLPCASGSIHRWR